VKLYETGIIIDPQLEESQFQSEIETVQNMITAAGGQMKKIDRWGMRRMDTSSRRSRSGP